MTLVVYHGIKSNIANEIAAILIDCWWILKSVLSLIRICFSVVQHAVYGEMRSYRPPIGIIQVW